MNDDWDTMTERRQDDKQSLYEQLGELRVRVTHIENSLAKLDKVSNQLDDFIKQASGVVWLVRGLFYIVGPTVAAYFWLKEHVV